MATTINRLARGLLDLLGNTNQGDNPSELLAQVRPSIDLGELYMSERITLFSQTGAINNGVPALDFSAEVPAGEIWLLRSLAYTIIVDTAGDAVHASLRMLNFPNLVEETAGAFNVHQLKSQLLGGATSAAGDIETIHYQWNPPLACVGGIRLQANADRVNVTAQTLTRGTLLYTRLNT